MFRSVIGIIFVLLYLILTIPIQGIYWLIGRRNRAKADMLSLKTVSWGCRVVQNIAGVKLRMVGRENVPKDTACMYVSNHSGYFDIIINYANADRLMGFVSKDSLEKVPSLNTWMRRVYCLFLNRDDIRSGLEMIKAAVDRINNGVSIFIFPEGVRSHDGKMNEFKAGSFKIALKSGCPIIPVAIRGTAEIFENQFPILRSGPVTVYFGKPIYPGDYSKEDQKIIHQITHQTIESMLQEIDRGAFR